MNVTKNLNYSPNLSLCVVCGNDKFKRSVDYMVCSQCGHQLLAQTADVLHIVNEDLDKTKYGKQTPLERFQVSSALDAAKDATYVLDFGSGSGRFLYSAQKLFSRHSGVEVSPSCIEFCRKDLGLNVSSQVPDDVAQASVVTLWHSLEHLDLSIFKNLLSQIKPGQRMLISVPNGDSFQFRIFKHRWAYYDVPHHLHQYSTLSLCHLMKDNGFQEVKSYSSLAYIGFGYLQSFMNVFSPQHNYFYYRKKRGMDFGYSQRKLNILDAYNLSLAVLLAPVAALFTVLDYLFPNKAGVITRSFEHK